jgi:hypothetical protein
MFTSRELVIISSLLRYKITKSVFELSLLPEKMNFEQLIQVFQKAHIYLRENAISAVNQSLTIRNWLFGHYIVEYEQNGEDRARYGTELMKNIADTLSSKNIKGLSARSLRNCRQFYLSYPNVSRILSELALPPSIWQTPSAKSERILKHSECKDFSIFYPIAATPVYRSRDLMR